MKLALSTTTLAVILLLFYILYLTQCRKTKCPPTNGSITKTVVDSSHLQVSSVPVIDTVYLPGEPIYHTTPGKPYPIPGKPYPVVREIPANVDTQAIILKYFSTVIQKDSLTYINKDSSTTVKIKTTDTVQLNQIIGRTWDIAVKTKTVSVQEFKRQFYWGGGLYGNKTDFISGAHVDIGYINKKGMHLKLDGLLMDKKLHAGLSFYQTFGR